MECSIVREQYVGALVASEATSADVDRHLESCEACRQELDSLAKTWTALGRLPGVEPGPRVGRRLRRRVRLEAVREVLEALRAWQQVALVGVAGSVVSMLLSLAVPYDSMVELCREFAPAVLPALVAYGVAGILYGLVPMAVGSALPLRLSAMRTATGAVEASAIFVLVLLPWVLLLCGAFPPALLAGFVTGIALGAVGGSLMVLPFMRARWDVRAVP